MKMLLLVFQFLSVPIWASRSKVESIPPEILKLIPNQYRNIDSEFKHAKKEILQLLQSCGRGVFVDAQDKNGDPFKNHCSYQVKLDELFFRPAWEKTGLLHNPDEIYQDGVTFYEPSEMDLPENFDLRDLMVNGQPEIRQQKCSDCWAWATHHGLEIARAVHDPLVLDLSSQSVLSCSNAGSCSGGYMSAVDFLKHGLPLESEFPYAASNKKCKYSSSEISSGWNGKVLATPYIGNSKNYFRRFQKRDGSFRTGAKVNDMMAAIYQWKSPLVVTVAAYSMSGPGVYDSCSAINSGGDHMVAIVGWETWNGKKVAHVWNSWGKGHGENGVSRIVWECGDGRLNRGLGRSAKIVQYKAPCTSPPDAGQEYMQEIYAGQTVEIGTKQPPNTQCTWTPSEGLSDPHSCVTKASPKKSTEYSLTAQNDCGSSSSMALVYVWGK